MTACPRLTTFSCSKKFFILLTLLFLLLTTVLDLFAESKKYIYNNFVIYAIERDSSIAKEAGFFLQTAYEEITYDLQITMDDTLYTYIVPNRKQFREIMQGGLPKWTEAFAVPLSRTMYVKSPAWNNNDTNIKTSLVHELFHLLIHEKLGIMNLPRWLDEGLAIFYSDDKKWITSTALSKALATNSVIPLRDIDIVLNFHRAKAELAYQQSYSAVEYILKTYDIDAIRVIVDGFSRGDALDVIFQHATGSDFDSFENEWKRYVKKEYKWFWIYEVDSYLWLFIFFLVFVAYVIKRIHTKRIKDEWEIEQESENLEGE